MRSQTNSYEVNGQPVKTAEDTEDDQTLTSCGFGSWRPICLQTFASPIFFLINMSLVGVVQGMTGSLFLSSISTLEKRYSFDSKVSAVILIADNLSQMLLSPVIGYISLRYNRAFLIGIGEIFLAFSCLITALPYFIFGPATHLIDDPGLLSSIYSNRTNFEMCAKDGHEYECKDGESNTVWLAVIIFFVGSFFKGIGFTCYFVIGYPLVDDSVRKKSSPLYMSVMQAIRLIGPASGFMLSSFCLRMYENPFINPGFGKKDPRFVGAWWLGFVIVGILLFIVSLPMLFYPFQFKGASVKASDMKKKMKSSGGSIDAAKRFVRNPIVMLYLIGNIFRYIGIGGYVMMKTKYIESQFRTSSSAASFITGSTIILPMATGILLGGIFLSLLKPSPKFILIYVFLVESFSLFGIGSGIFLGCDQPNIGQLDNTGKFSLTAFPCNQNCDCSTRVFTPVCGPDSKSYFSPCTAGCSLFNSRNQTFENCACFEDGGVASKGYCSKDKKDCPNLYPYLGIVLFGAFISSTSRTANSLVSFRTVDPADKGVTMGIASAVMAIFAFIPYPLIFGYLVDSACLVWDLRCGKTGNCWVYDNEKFRVYLHFGAIFFMGIGSIFDFIMIFFHDKVKNFYDDGEEEENNVVERNSNLKVEMSAVNPMFISEEDEEVTTKTTENF